MNGERSAATRAFESAMLKFEAALAKVDAALTSPPTDDEAAHIAALERHARQAAPLLLRQQSFNAAIVNEVKHQRSIQRAVLELIRSQLALVEFVRTIKPYVDTREFADILRAIAEEDLKRADALLARDRVRELQLADVEAELISIRTRLDELQRTLAS